MRPSAQGRGQRAGRPCTRHPPPNPRTPTHGRDGRATLVPRRPVGIGLEVTRGVVEQLGHRAVVVDWTKAEACAPRGVVADTSGHGRAARLVLTVHAFCHRGLAADGPRVTCVVGCMSELVPYQSRLHQSFKTVCFRLRPMETEQCHQTWRNTAVLCVDK